MSQRHAVGYCRVQFRSHTQTVPLRVCVLPSCESPDRKLQERPDSAIPAEAQKKIDPPATAGCLLMLRTLSKRDL